MIGSEILQKAQQTRKKRRKICRRIIIVCTGMSENCLMVRWILSPRKYSLLIEDLTKINALSVCRQQISRQPRQGLAAKRAASVPQRSNLRCCWNTLCSSASRHLLLLAVSRYQMEISHRSSPKTAPTLSWQQTFTTRSLRHLRLLTTGACKSACVCKGPSCLIEKYVLFWWLFEENLYSGNFYKKGSWFHSNDNILLGDGLFIKSCFKKKKILLLKELKMVGSRYPQYGCEFNGLG